MKWIGEHIWDLTSRFRNDVYLEDLTEVEQEFTIQVAADGKLTKSTAPSERSRLQVRNDEGSVIPAGAPLYSRGEIGGSSRIKVGICVSSDPAKMPCIGIAEFEMNTSSTKDSFAVTQGVYNTNIHGFTGLSEGDILYVNGGVAPHLTPTKPTNGDLIQNVGIVLKTNGTICQGLLVAAIGRTNDVPWPLYVDHTTQRVSIGTSSPTVPFHVIGDARIQGNLTVNGTYTQIDTDVNTTEQWLVTNDGTGPAAVINQLGSQDIFDVQDDGTSVFYVKDGGNVGIGTTSPAYKLDVDGGAQFNTNTGATPFYITRLGSADQALSIKVMDDDVRFESIQDESADSYGGFDFRMDGGVTEPNFTIRKNSAAAILHVDGGGNVGIGTTSPSEKLDVVGNIRVGDNDRIKIGNGGDMYLLHNGTDSVLVNTNGDLKISNQADDKDIIFQCDDGSGGVETYFYLDGSYGANPYTIFPDNSTLAFGSNRDLLIVHDATDSKIDNYVGDLKIRNFADDKDIIFQSDDGSGGVETYFYLDGSASSGNPITQFPDLSQLAFGNSQDLLLRHDGTDSLIQNNGGDFIIQQHTNDKDLIFKCDDGSGSTTAYLTLDGSSGYTKAHKHILYEDNAKAMFGTGGDMQILHDGSNSYISQNVTGNLYIENNATDGDVVFRSDDGSGGITPYLTIDGSAEQTRFFKDTRHTDGIKANFGNSDDLEIYHDGSNSYIDQTGTGNLYIRNTQEDGLIYMQSNYNGSVSSFFYLHGAYSSNNPYTIFPDNSIAAFGNAADLRIKHDGSNSYIQQSGTGDLYIQQNVDDRDIVFQSDDGSGGVQTYLTIDGSNGYIRLEDDRRLTIGSGNDLQLKHSSGASSITNFTGAFNIVQEMVDGDIIFSSDNGSGSTTEYFRVDGSSVANVFSEKIEVYKADASANPRVSIGRSSGEAINFDVEDRTARIYHKQDETTGSHVLKLTVDSDTSDTKDIHLGFRDADGSNESIKFTVDESGNVGIGTTSPSEKLEVAGNIKIGDNDVIKIGDGDDLRIQHSSGDSSAYIQNYTGNLNIQNLADDKDIIFQSDDGSGGVTTYLTIDGGLGHTTIDKRLRANDNVDFAVGTGNDLRLVHDGTHSYMTNYTGDFYIANHSDDKDVILQSDDGSGGLTSYLKLWGAIESLAVYKDMLFIHDGDGGKLKFGASQDLQIYHDGSHSYIKDSGTGNLRIDASDFYVRNSGGTKIAIDALDGAEVALRYDGSRKLETTSTGVEVTGLIDKDANSTSTIIRTSRTDDTQQGLFRTDGWGNFTFNKAVGVGYDTDGILGSAGVTGLVVSGRVGAGTASPAQALDVVGNIAVSGSVQRQISTTHHTFTTVSGGSAAQDYWVPFIGTNELAAPNVTHRTIAPYGGILKKAIVHSTAAFGSSAQVRFHRIDNGTASVFTNLNDTDDVTTNVTGSLATAYTSTEFIFTTGNTFSTGDQVGVSFVRNNTAQGDVAMTLVWEYELF